MEIFKASCNRYRFFYLFALLLAPSLAIGLTPQEIYKKASPSICLVEATNSVGDTSIGTGFLIDSKGQVATNLHVIKGAVSIKVTCSHRSSASTKYFDAKQSTDLAVLETSLQGLESLTISKSSPEIGQPVVVIGNPKGLRNSLTQGLVSNLHQYEGNEFLQIDAAINPGNSGGPVFDEKGEVIGIATFAYKGAQNINFALSVNAFTQLSRIPKELSVDLPPEKISEPTPPPQTDRFGDAWRKLQDKPAVIANLGIKGCVAEGEEIDQLLAGVSGRVKPGTQTSNGYWLIKPALKKKHSLLNSLNLPKGRSIFTPQANPLCVRIYAGDELGIFSYGIGISSVKLEFRVFDEFSAKPLTKCGEAETKIFLVSLYDIKTNFSDAFRAFSRFDAVFPSESELPHVSGCIDGTSVETKSYDGSLVLKARILDYEPVTMGGVDRMLADQDRLNAERYK